MGNKILQNLMRWHLKHTIMPMYKDGGLALFGCSVFVIALILDKRGFDMKKILVATLIGMMLLVPSAAADLTKSTTTSTITTPNPDAAKSKPTENSSASGPDTTKSTTTTTSTTHASEPTSTTTATATSTTPGFEAIFAVAGLLAVTFVALRRRC